MWIFLIVTIILVYRLLDFNLIDWFVQDVTHPDHVALFYGVLIHECGHSHYMQLIVVNVKVAVERSQLRACVLHLESVVKLEDLSGGRETIHYRHLQVHKNDLDGGHPHALGLTLLYAKIALLA